MSKSHEEWVEELKKAAPEEAARVFDMGDRKRALGRALWEAFCASGLSKAELARRMGTSVAAVNRLFDANHAGSQTVTTLIKFEQATGAQVFAHEIPDERRALQQVFAAMTAMADDEAAAARFEQVLERLLEGTIDKIAARTGQAVREEFHAHLLGSMPQPGKAGGWTVPAFHRDVERDRTRIETGN